MNTIIIGAGIVGRFAKILMPEAILLEASSDGSKITTDFLGTNMCRLPIPELNSVEGILRIKIDGEDATEESVSRYRQFKFQENRIEFGDYKQFNPIQIVHFINKPEVPVLYNQKVVKINAIDKTIETIDTVSLKRNIIDYDCIINTIPLLNLIQIVDITSNSPFINTMKNKLIHKNIFYKEKRAERSITESNEIILDFKTSVESTVNRVSFYLDRESCESYYSLGEGQSVLYPGKIMGSEFTEDIAKDFQLYNIYCYGRYARWRHKEMLHETFKNLRRFCERKGQIGYGG